MAPEVSSLIHRSARLEIEDLDFDSFATHRLHPDSLRCLRYMHDVEGHTMCYLRDVLVTRAHKDPDITAFLACWGYEELWHGEAIARFSTPTEKPRVTLVSKLCGAGFRDAMGFVHFCSRSARPSPRTYPPCI